MAQEPSESEDPQTASFKRRIEQLERVNEKLTNEVVALNRSNKDLSNRAEHLAQVIRGIESSQVWKLTRPLVSLLQSAKLLVRKPQTGASSTATNELPASVKERYKILFERTWPSPEELEKQRQLAAGAAFSTLILVDEGSVSHLAGTLASVRSQSYGNSAISILRTNGFSAEMDAESVCANAELLPQGTLLSDAIRELTGEFAVVLKAGIFLWPNALHEAATTLLNKPTALFLYGDEDTLEPKTKAHISPYLRPDWSPAYLRATNYIGDLGFYSTKLLNELAAEPLASVYDLHLAVLRHLESTQSPAPYKEAEKHVVHLPKVIATSLRKPDPSDKESLERDLHARRLKGTLTESLPGLFRTEEAGVRTELVTIIIPTKDNLQFIQRCVDSILAKTTYPHIEILIVDTGSSDESVHEYYKQVGQNSKVRLLEWAEPFNFSAVCNYGAQQAKGRFFLFLNNDTEVISTDWIESMLEYGVRPEVGSVGAKLLYPNGTLQHVGVVPGILGVAGHYLSGEPDKPGLSFPTKYTKDAPREFSCCTAACLLVRKDVFEAAAGFDESYRITFNDVDFAMRLLYDHGLYNVYTPFAVLTHYESVSVGPPGGDIRGPQEFQMECDRMIARWSSVLTSDPFYHPLIDLGSNIPNIRL